MNIQNEFNDLECGRAFFTPCTSLPPLPGKDAKWYTELAEKYGGSSDDFICGDVVEKSLNLRDKRVEATIRTPVAEKGEEDGEFVGTRTTRTFMEAEDTAGLAHLYGMIFPNCHDALVAEKSTGRVVRLLCDH